MRVIWNISKLINVLIRFLKVDLKITLGIYIRRYSSSWQHYRYNVRKSWFRRGKSEQRSGFIFIYKRVVEILFIFFLFPKPMLSWLFYFVLFFLNLSLVSTVMKWVRRSNVCFVFFFLNNSFFHNCIKNRGLISLCHYNTKTFIEMKKIIDKITTSNPSKSIWKFVWELLGHSLHLWLSTWGRGVTSPRSTGAGNSPASPRSTGAGNSSAQQDRCTLGKPLPHLRASSEEGSIYFWRSLSLGSFQWKFIWNKVSILFLLLVYDYCFSSEIVKLDRSSLIHFLLCLKVR